VSQHSKKIRATRLQISRNTGAEKALQHIYISNVYWKLQMLEPEFA